MSDFKKGTRPIAEKPVEATQQARSAGRDADAKRPADSRGIRLHV